MTRNSDRLLNVGLRLTTLGARFLLIFFLARYLTPDSVGYYGLFTAAVGYAIYFVGLDFYVYMTREVIAAPPAQRGGLVKGQIALSTLLYVALLPLALFLLQQSGWPTWLLWWFIPILVLEHVNQEIYRLLIALSRQTVASLQHFIRQGSWAVAVVGLMAFFPESRRLDLVMVLWAAAGVLAAAGGTLALLRTGMGGWRLPIDRSWIFAGIRISLAFLVATLALRGIQTIDRYWIEALGGIEAVGAYVLFFGISGALMVFLDAGVFAFAYPDLVRQAQAGAYDAMRLRLRQMLFQILVASAAFVLISWLLMPVFLDWIGHALYRESLELFPWLLGATVLNALGLIPHYALYARRCDRTIILSHLSAIPTFALGGWLLAPHLGVAAVPASLCFAFIIILIWKSLAWFSLDRNTPQPEHPAVSA